MVARFRKTIPTVTKKFHHPRSRNISDFDQNYHFTLFQKIRIFPSFTTCHIQMLIYVPYISFTHAYVILYFLIISCFILDHLHFSSCSYQHVLVIVYISSHSNAMLLISCHVIYFYHFESFAYTYYFFMFHIYINLRS